jgi:predicted molibdopterin-dependent oxidoreductase YjgC
VTERCVTCAKNEHCELQTVVDYLGITEIPFRRTQRTYGIDDSNPFFYRDLNKCILCSKCVRVCDEVVGASAIAIINRGYSSKVAVFGDKPMLDSSSCVSCGECVAHCPVAALMPKEDKLPTEEVATTCTYCGVGCGMYLGVRDGKVISVRGSRDNTVNNGFLCVKGRFGFDFVNHPDRLKAPFIKKDGKFVEASWDEALELAASRLAKYGPEELAVVSSAKCTNEENYLAQKFARAVLPCPQRGRAPAELRQRGDDQLHQRAPRLTVFPGHRHQHHRGPSHHQPGDKAGGEQRRQADCGQPPRD